jgi:spore germination protein KB
MRQAVILFLLLVFSSTIRFLPTYVAKTGERAGWLTPVFSILPFVCLVYIIQALFKNNKEANLSDIIFKIFGKTLGTVILTLYLIWMMVFLGIIVRYFAEKFLTSVLPNTPLNFFTVTILTVVFYAIRGGIVFVSRTAEFLFLLFTVTFTVLFLFTIPNLEVINLFPITHYDVLPLIKSSYSNISIWGAFTYIFFFGERVNDKEHVKRFGMQGAVYMVITTLMLLIQTIGVYGYSLVERTSAPYISAVKSISLLQTIERIESVSVTLWAIADFVPISVTIFIIVSIIKSLFSLSEVKSLVSPITILAFIFSQYIAHNSFELENFANYISIPTGIIFGFIFPLVILIIGKIRKKI